jgi:mono/diheme cytochrome c family protein
MRHHLPGMMGHVCEAGAATNGALPAQHCRGRGMHRMMGRSFSVPTTVAEATETKGEAVQAGAPAGFLTELKSADPARGRQLVLANACIGCHSLNPSQRMAGPTWHALAETAASRVAGQSAAHYLYTSIVQPNAFVVAGYLPGIMVQNYGQQLSEGDIADIVAYLLTLHEE